MTVKKVVIPVAGLGTRMLPLTKAIPKEMLPVVDKPLIQYIVEECAAAGLTEVIFVTHASKNSIENHFDTSFELEATLESRVKRQLLDEIKSITPADVTVMHVRQGEAKGLGHAVLCAKPLVGDNPFAVVLPDVLINHYCSDPAKDNLAELVASYQSTGVSQVLVERVATDEISNYGIVDIANKDFSVPVEIRGIVEKPSREDAPSDLAVVGRYVFSPEIWRCLKATAPGAGGEIQLTDAIFSLMDSHKVYAGMLRGKSHDCGNKLGYFKTCIEYLLKSDLYSEEIDLFIKSQCSSIGLG